LPLPEAPDGAIVKDSWKSSISAIDIPVSAGNVQLKGSLNSCIVDARSWGQPQFEFRLLPTHWTGSFNQSSLSFTLVVPQAGGAAPLPASDSGSLQQDDNGSFTFASTKFGLLLQGAGFVKGAANVNVDSGFPTQSGNTWETQGFVALPDGQAVHLTERITKQAQGYAVEIKLTSPTPIKAQNTALVAALPSSFYAGKSISYNGGAESLPVTVGHAMIPAHWKGGISFIDIPTPNGGVRLSGNLTSGVADERNWGVQQFGLRLMFNRVPADLSGFTEATLKFSISTSGEARMSPPYLPGSDGSVRVPLNLSAWDLPPPWAAATAVEPGIEPNNPVFKIVSYHADWGYQPTLLILYPREIARVVFFGRIKATKVTAGPQFYMMAQAHIQFLDDRGEMVGDWPAGTNATGTTDWIPFKQDLTCPRGTRVAKLIVGLCMSTGTAAFDGMQIKAYDQDGNVVAPIPTPKEVRTDTTGWWQFSPGQEDTTRPLVIDMSQYIPAPAGKFGSVTVRDGHFAFANGKRVKFWGAGAANWCPAKADSDRIAQTLVRDGVNLVRFHGMDAQNRPESIFDPTSDRTDRLDPVKLDRMDYHFANLKKHGVYVDLNLLTKRRYLPGDGVMDSDKLPEGGKCAALFDRRLIDLQKDYDRLLLTHVNPYTRLAYKDDPAVALVEIINETSLFNLRFMGGIPASYENELNDQFKQWCAQNSVTQPADPIVKLLDRKTLEAVRFASFVESSYYHEMYDYLKKDIGVKALVTGTSFAHEVDEKRIANQMDFVDAHAYHDNPSGGWTPTADFDNRPLVKTSPNIVDDLAIEAIAGKPFTVSEWNTCWSNQYVTEGPFIMGACVGLQDWDAPMVFNVSGAGWQQRMNDCFEDDSKPHVMAPFIASALSYYRGDIRPGPLKQVNLDIAGIGATTGDLYHVTRADTASDILTHRDRISIAAKPGRQQQTAAIIAESNVAVADQIHWDTKQGLFVLNTPALQGVVGFTDGQAVNTNDVAIQIRNPFAQVIVTSLSGSPIRSSKHLLITATAQAENSYEVYRLFYKGLVSIGDAPILMEPVHASITLKAIGDALPSAYILDWYGRRTHETLPVSRRAEARYNIDIGARPGAWFEIVYGPKP